MATQNITISIRLFSVRDVQNAAKIMADIGKQGKNSMMIFSMGNVLPNVSYSPVFKC